MKMKNLYLLFFGILIVSCTAEQNSESTAITQNGSYATMLTIGNKLYAINDRSLTTFDISVKNNPKQIDQKDVGFSIESLLSYNDLLIIGSSSFMHIYKLKEGIPAKESSTSYNNLAGCSYDPIVIKNNFAYVTISSAILSNCNRRTDELRTYDITDLKKPMLLNSVSLPRPKGLGIDGNLLFVCDENEGLKIFNIETQSEPKLFKEFKGFSAYDLIPNKGILLVSAKDKLMQYDYSNIADIKLISVIEL
jgi:hypothetical protein